jgi:hypothetical protein
MDPDADPGGPKTLESYGFGSGSATLLDIKTKQNLKTTSTYTESTDLTPIGHQKKIFILWHRPFKETVTWFDIFAIFKKKEINFDKETGWDRWRFISITSTALEHGRQSNWIAFFSERCPGLRFSFARIFMIYFCTIMSLWGATIELKSFKIFKYLEVM